MKYNIFMMSNLQSTNPSFLESKESLLDIDSGVVDMPSFALDQESLADLHRSFSNVVEHDLPRHFVVKNGSDRKFTGLPGAVLKALIAKHLGSGLQDFPDVFVYTDKKTNEKSVNVEVRSDEQASKLLKTKSIANIPVVVSPHETRNKTRVMIWDADLNLSAYNDAQIQCILKDQAVVKVERQKYRDREGKLVLGKQYMLWFEKRVPPQHVHFFGERIQTKLYVPRPFRCFHCQRFGHGKESCRAMKRNEGAVCVNCGMSHVPAEGGMDVCVNQAKCVNCDGSHKASDRECPAYVQEVAVFKKAAEERISVKVARERMHIVDYSKPTAAKIVRAGVAQDQGERLGSVEQSIDNLSNLIAKLMRSINGEDDVEVRLNKLEEKVHERDGEIEKLKKDNSEFLERIKYQEKQIAHMESVKRQNLELNKQVIELREAAKAQENDDMETDVELKSKNDMMEKDMQRKDDKIKSLTKLNDELTTKVKVLQQARLAKVGPGNRPSQTTNRTAQPKQRDRISSSQPAQNKPGGGDSKV